MANGAAGATTSVANLYSIVVQGLSAGGVRLAALATEHSQGTIEGGNLKEMIQVGAGYHLVDKRPWIDQFQFNFAAHGPTVKRYQQRQPASIQRFHIGQVEQNDACVLLFEHSTLEDDFLPPHNAPTALHDCQVIGAFCIYR
jgi:hypothetical protein